MYIKKFDPVLAQILMGELIGSEVLIVKSTSRELIGVEGKIIDETLNTFLIEKKEGRKVLEIKIPKKLCIFRFYVDDKSQEIDGKDLVFRPEDRIKKYWRKFDARMRRRELSKARKTKGKGKHD